MTKLFNGKRAASLMEVRGIDILVGSGYVNFGYLAGYFTHFGRDYPGPLVNGAPLVRFAGVPKDPNLSPFLITYPGEEGDIVAQGSWIDERMFWGPQYRVTGRPEPLRVREDTVACLAEAFGARGLESAAISCSISSVTVSVWTCTSRRT